MMGRHMTCMVEPCFRWVAARRDAIPGGGLRADAAGIPAGKRGPAGMPAVPGQHGTVGPRIA